MESTKEKEHFLALKVMRLTRPMLLTSPERSREYLSQLVTGNDQRPENCSDDFQLDGFSLAPLLTLPQNFGNIFLGETFSSYISIRNESNQAARDVLIKTDLQTSSQRLGLAGASGGLRPELGAGRSIDDVIHHEAKELGTHILVCAVSYSTQLGEKLSFRKFFKFQVLKPLDVKTKFYSAENEDVFLEAQVQNLTPTPVYLERVNLEPVNQYTVTDLNFTDEKKQNSVHGDFRLLAPMSILQFLYQLRPRTKEPASPGVAPPSSWAVGKLDIVWRSQMGERGRLQTSPLQRSVASSGELRVVLESLPAAAGLETPFPLQAKVTNTSERAVDLRLSLENDDTSAVHWLGVSGRELGKLHPGRSLAVPLRALPLLPGLQTVEGVRLTDTLLKRTYEFDDLAKILVTPSFADAS